MGSDEVFSALNKSYIDQIRPKLDLIDQLRSIGIAEDIGGIPQIAAVGDQSSGKSSVLEAISGIPFPRGTGTVTRCATEIRMKMTQGSNGAFKAKVYTTLDDKDDFEVIEDRYLVADSIVAEQRRLCKGNNFSPHSIIIEIESHDVPDLTLIDLPGIIRNADGEITEQDVIEVDAIMEKYLNFERTILMAVVPASQDIATVEVLSRVRKADPEGVRTIGVLTKPDLVDMGAEDRVLNVLNGSSNALKLGWVVIKNRSQADINDKLTMKDAEAAEENFFKSHKIYKLIQDSQKGKNALTTLLTKSLIQRIDAILPLLKEEIFTSLSQVRSEIQELPPVIGDSMAEKSQAILQRWRTFEAKLDEGISARYSTSAVNSVENHRVLLYSQLLHHFMNFQTRLRDSRPNFSDDEYVDALYSKIRDYQGRQVPGFLNSFIFEKIVREFISSWSDECGVLVKQTAATMKEYVFKYSSSVLMDTPKLRSQIDALVHSLLDSLESEAMKETLKIFERESQPFTLNHYMMDNVNKLFKENSGEYAVRKLMLDDFVKNVKIGFSKKLEEYRTKQSYQYAESDSVILVDAAAWLDEIIEAEHSNVDVRGYDVNMSTENNLRQEARHLSIILISYWKVAMKRVIDNVPQLIDQVLVRKFPVQLSEKFYMLFSDNEFLEAVSYQCGDLVENRKRLDEKKTRLENALACLF